jgi:SNF2 family DNA or RNA helicase
LYVFLTSDSFAFHLVQTERTIEVDFLGEEKKEYEALDMAALDFYNTFKRNNYHKMGKHYLVLTQKLTPLRIAASGGRVPLDGGGEESQDPGDLLMTSRMFQRRRGRRSNAFLSLPTTARSRRLLPSSNVLEMKILIVRDHSFLCPICCLVVSRFTFPLRQYSAKSLVFSQFASTLKWLQKSLPKHGFQYRTLKGDMSMEKCANSPSRLSA